MGRATVNTHDPNEFLRRTKRDELTTCEESKSFKYTDRNKAPLPDFKNIEYKPSVSSKDFIKKVSDRFNQVNYVQNAINVIKSSAKKGEPKFVDTVGGNSSPLKPSGLVPNVSASKLSESKWKLQYVNKNNYGKVPKYLIKRQESDKQQLSEYQRHVAQAYEENAVKQMSQEERNQLISGLKANWEELHHQYQGLSVVTDTGKAIWRFL